MNKFKYIIIIFITMFVFNINGLAASTKFEPTINMQPEITENQISIVLGFKGEEIMAITHSLSYDSKYLTLIDVKADEYFTITKGNEVSNGNYRTIKILGDSDYSFLDTNYAILTFEITDKFKVSSSTSVFLYTYEAAGPEKNKVRHKGYEMTLRRDSNTSVLYLLDEIDDNTKMRYWFYENIGFIILICIIVVGIVILILAIPTKRRKEHREKSMSSQLKQEHYPNQNVEPIKIDQSKIDSIGKVEKEVDMTEAIEISEINPFAGTTGESKFSDTNQNANNANIAFQATTIDVFNQNKAPEVVEMPQVKQENKPFPTDQFKEIKEDENKEDLVLFQPVFEEDKKDDSNIETLSFFVALFLSLALLVPNIKAEEYRVSELRDCIVGNIPYNKDLDYSGDGNIDIIDLLSTKNLIDVNFESQNGNSLGFEELEGESSTLIGIDKYTTTTTKSTKSTKTIKTSTRQTNANNKTTNKVINNKTTKKTTTKKETTTKAQYTVSITYNNANSTSNSKSVKKDANASFTVTPDVGYVFSSVSCTGGHAASYSKSTKKLTVKDVISNTTCTLKFVERDDIKIKISASYGTASPTTITGKFKSSGEATVKPKTGYEFDNVSCTNGVNASYDINSNILTIPSLSNDSTCKVIFVPKTYTVTLKADGASLDAKYKYNEKANLVIYSNDGNKTKLYCGSTKKTFKVSEVTNSAIKYKYQYTFTYTVRGNVTCTLS